MEKPFVGKTNNPLYGQISPEYIEPFDVTLTTQMVQALGGHMGLGFSDEICAYLTRDYGGHPFLIWQACSAIDRILSKSRVASRVVHSHRQEALRGSGQAGTADQLYGPARKMERSDAQGG